MFHSLGYTYYANACTPTSRDRAAVTNAVCAASIQLHACAETTSFSATTARSYTTTAAHLCHGPWLGCKWAEMLLFHASHDNTDRFGTAARSTCNTSSEWHHRKDIGGRRLAIGKQPAGSSTSSIEVPAHLSFRCQPSYGHQPNGAGWRPK